jgi:ADP-ribose pyrophosphatase YjhB (NUDIX family)
MEPAVGIVALTDDQLVYLIGQFRYATDSYSWEIVTGYADAGEDVLEAAKRELREETGLLASEWTALGHIEISNGVTDQLGFLFLARALANGPSAPDETEELAVKTAFLRDVMGQAQGAFSIASASRPCIAPGTICARTSTLRALEGSPDSELITESDSPRQAFIGYEGMLVTLSGANGLAPR